MPGPSAKPTACAVVRKPIQRPCFERGIVSPTIDIVAGVKPEINMPSAKRMSTNSSGTFTNARSRLVTIKPAREMKRMGLRPMRPDHVPIGVLKSNIPRPKAPSIKARVSGPNPNACKRCGKTGMIMANPVIIRVMQPSRNVSATVIDLDFLTGVAAMGSTLTTSSRGTLTVSCSRTAVFICCILSDLAEVSDNTLATYPLPSLTLVVLFPSLLYDLQFASIFSLSLLPGLPKTGNHTKGDRKGRPRGINLSGMREISRRGGGGVDAGWGVGALVAARRGPACLPAHPCRSLPPRAATRAPTPPNTTPAPTRDPSPSPLFVIDPTRIDSEDSSHLQRRSRHFAPFHECVGSSFLSQLPSELSRQQGQRFADRAGHSSSPIPPGQG